MLDKSILYAEIWMKRAHAHRSSPFNPITIRYAATKQETKGTGHG